MKPPRRAAVAVSVLLLGGLVPPVAVGGPAGASGLGPTEWVIGPMQRVAFLTIDGSASRRLVGKVVDDLKAADARASFFLPGKWIRFNQGPAQRMKRAGFAFGNRGYREDSFEGLSDDQIRASLTQAEQQFAKINVYPRPFFRAPRYKRDLRIVRAAASLGYRSVGWTHHPGGGSARAVKKAVVRKALPGSIISLDVWRRSHRRALTDIVRGLRKRGFELRTIESLRNAHPVPMNVTLKSGMRGPEVYHLDKRLKFWSYEAGSSDSSFDYGTLQGVYAYEKANKLTRDGVVTPQQLAEIYRAGPPWVRDRGRGKWIDIDISRQVLFEVRGGRVTHTLPISSGNEQYYTSDGERRKAHTPRGDFVIERKIAGWRTSDLGRLYYPSYFVGGYAVHGSTSVPTYPASHGCVRIPMYATRPFFNRNPVGTPTHVHN